MNTSFRASQIKTPACVGVFFRPGVLTVSGRGSIQVCVQVPPDPLQKILKAPPDKLHRSSGETVVQRVMLYSKQACGSTAGSVSNHRARPPHRFLWSAAVCSSDAE